MTSQISMFLFLRELEGPQPLLIKNRIKTIKEYKYRASQIRMLT